MEIKKITFLASTNCFFKRRNWNKNISIFCRQKTLQVNVMKHIRLNDQQVVESEKTAKWQYTRHCEDLSVEIKKLREEVNLQQGKTFRYHWIIQCSISCLRWRRSGDCCHSDSFWDLTGALSTSIDHVTIV